MLLQKRDQQQQEYTKMIIISNKFNASYYLTTATIITLLIALTATSVQSSSPWQAQQQQQQFRHQNNNNNLHHIDNNNNNYHHHHHHQPRAVSFLAARRAADDSRPLLRVASPSHQQQQHTSPLNLAESQNDQIVVGKFHAPAPEQIYQQRIPKSSQFGAQTMRASYRVTDADHDSSAASNEKVVHGIVGSSLRPQSIQRTVGAKIMVSDEGLNYPPSKLSADIYGNVAEIVTAPPEAVDNDFLYPKSSRFSRP